MSPLLKHYCPVSHNVISQCLLGHFSIVFSPFFLRLFHFVRYPSMFSVHHPSRLSPASSRGPCVPTSMLHSSPSTIRKSPVVLGCFYFLMVHPKNFLTFSLCQHVFLFHFQHLLQNIWWKHNALTRSLTSILKTIYLSLYHTHTQKQTNKTKNSGKRKEDGGVNFEHAREWNCLAHDHHDASGSFTSSYFRSPSLTFFEAAALSAGHYGTWTITSVTGMVYNSSLGSPCIKILNQISSIPTSI